MEKAYFLIRQHDTARRSALLFCCSEVRIFYKCFVKLKLIKLTKELTADTIKKNNIQKGVSSMAIDKENFISWLSSMTGDKPMAMASKLNASPSLISRYASGERRPTLAILKKIEAVYQIKLDVLRQKVIQYQPVLTDVMVDEGSKKDSQALRILELEEQLSRLRNPQFALLYSLEDRLPPATIEKLAEFIAIEIKFATANKRNHKGDEE